MSNLKSKFSILTGIISFLTLFSSNVFAGTGGTLVYAPVNTTVDPTSVPTLSGIMLVFMSLLLFAVGYRVAKQKNSKAGKLFMTLICVGALASGIGGAKMINEVTAADSDILLSNAGGGTVGIPQNVVSIFENSSGVTQKIISISLPGNCNGIYGSNPGVAECSVNLVLPQMNSCFLDCTNFGGGDGIGTPL